MNISPSRRLPRRQLKLKRAAQLGGPPFRIVRALSLYALNWNLVKSSQADNEDTQHRTSGNWDAKELPAGERTTDAMTEKRLKKIQSFKHKK